MWIMRDITDKDNYLFGIKKNDGKFSWWAMLHIDAVYDLWSKEASEDLQKRNFRDGPIEFECTLKAR